MTAKNKRPAGGRANEISWGDYSQYTARRRPNYRNNAPCMPMSVWVYWEHRRYLLETETPGLYGTYGKEDAE